MKIQVCQIYFKKKIENEEKIIDVDVKKFFERICDFDKLDRTSETNKYSPVLVDIRKVLPNDKLGISFYKYREGEKPYIENENGDLTQLEETLVELTNTYLDDTNNILCVQYNYNGIKIKKIEEYLNEFIDDDTIKLYIEPLYKDFTLNLIYNSDRIKDIYIKFSKDIFSYSDKKHTLFTPITSFLNTSNENTQEVLELSLKSSRGKRFDGRAVEELVNSTEENSSIKDILVEYKDRNGGYKKESIKKLKEELYFSISSNKHNKNLGWEYIIDNIYFKYQEIENKVINIVMETLLEKEAFSDEIRLKKL
ncbi:MAG: DUF6731 family protein [Fusobacterium sp.]